jgi:phosphocarrier protein FPr
VGVFRTEILFLRRASPPSEEEQVAAYRRALAGLDGRLLVIRTLDVGGDKPLPYLPLPSETNPFLGRRGIRFTLAHPALFRTQMRAALRAGADAPGQVALMFPMVSTLDELLEAKALLLEAQDELARAGTPCDPGVRAGIMVETPAAVTLAPRLAEHAAFFSIGTNDLAQYVMAADRGNRDVADLVDALHPPVLHAIRATADAARAAGIPVAVCGELAADPGAAALLVGLGVDELSMGAPAIAQVKAAIRRTDRAAAQALAARALAAPSARAVAALLDVERDSSRSAC